jgi:hypothetical protein
LTRLQKLSGESAVAMEILLKGRLRTVDLLFKIACIVKRRKKQHKKELI